MNTSENTRSMTIAEFLLHRIAEDEAVARDVAAERKRVASVIGYDVDIYDRTFWADYDGAGPSVSVGADRVLEDLEAKRRIVALDGNPALSNREDLRQVGFRWAVDRVLATLASVYADHPDYDPEWRL